MRKLAKIVNLHTVEDHPNADRLDIVKWDGWQCVVKRDEFKVGDLAIAFEIDSFLPTSIAPFLTKPGHFPKVFEGIEGERLRTVRLRGLLSQGLVLPLSILSDTVCPVEGMDVTDVLGILKYERPMDAQLAGQARGIFPSFVRKTDQERCQNLVREIQTAYDNGDEFEITMKLDGSSCTVIYLDNDIRVCSRNLDLKLDEVNSENTFIKTANNTGLIVALQAYGQNIAVQAELMGPKIQDNREGLTSFMLYVFDIFDIDTQKYLSPAKRMEAFNALRALGANIEHVPIIETSTKLMSADIQILLNYAEGPSIVNKTREGLVYKRLDGGFSFKTISNQYLIQSGN